MTMKKELYNAAINGNVRFVSGAISRETQNGTTDEYSVCQTTIQGNNIIHLAVQHQRLDFLKAALEGFPCLMALIHQSNSNGDTPLHTAAIVGNMVVVELLVKSYKKGSSSKQQPPWKVMNKEGNTPLHLALIHGKVWVAEYLVKLGPDDVAGFINNSSETPLHLAVRFSVEGEKELAMEAMHTIKRLGAGMTYKGCRLAEDSLSIIGLLLQRKSSAACSYDTNHLTPLLRATRKSHMQAVKAIISECPESVEMADQNGRTLLHCFKPASYEQAKELLKFTQVEALKNQQDNDGNTPAHVAANNCDVNMVRALLECSTNFTIENKEGVSAAALIQQQTTKFLANKPLTNLPYVLDLINPDGMPPELHKSAKDGEVDLLRKKLRRNEKEYLLSRTNDGMNILHIASVGYVGAWNVERRSKVKQFMEEAMERLPILICQTNKYGQTPLHIRARSFAENLIDGALLEKSKWCFEKATEEEANEQIYCPPWRVKDLSGNTPLFQALASHSVNEVRALMEFDNQVAQDVNNERQTVLHLLDVSMLGGFGDEDIDLIIQANPCALDACDSEGLTPFLRAGRNRVFRVALRMIHHSRGVISQVDDRGNTILHLMASQPAKYHPIGPALDELFKKLHSLCYKENNDGKMAAQLAIEKHNFTFISLLIKGDFDLSWTNSEGISTVDLIGSASDLPRELQELLWKDPEQSVEVFGRRTICGIPTPEIKDYVNTISVTAALLATITFTAAFTVPGGFNSEHGTPILAKQAAFCVFLVSDIAAMCLSMMVLFCLLWVMCGNRTEKVVLVDLSVFLLQASFYATLLAFMTGVYVTMIPIVRWLALLPCVACSVLILLMRRSLVMGFARASQKTLYASYRLVCYVISESVRYLMYKITTSFAKLCCRHDGEENQPPEFFELFNC